MSTGTGHRESGPVIVVPPSRRMVLRALREAGHGRVAWCYLGETVPRAVACGRWLEGRAERVEVGAWLQETARDLRQPFIEYIGELSEQYHSEAWWLTSISEKNPYVSRVFLRTCYVRVAERVVRESDGRSALLLIVESRAVRQCLREHLASRVEDHMLFPERPGAGLPARVLDYLEFWVRWLHFLGRHLVRLAIARLYVPRSIHETDGRAGGLTLLHSWVDGRCFDEHGCYRSINFGDLAEYLTLQRRRVAIVPSILPALLFHSGVRALVRSRVAFLLPHRFLKPADVVHAAVRTLAPQPAVSWPTFRGMDISALILEDRHQDWLKGRTRQNVLIGAAVERWREAGIRIESFIYTFENHLWEKTYCLAMRRHYPSARLIGYQDANLPTMALNFFVAEREQALVPLPDLLIANGRYSYDLLVASGYGPARLRCGGALRYRHLVGLAAGAKPSSESRIKLRAGSSVVLVTTSIGAPFASELLWKSLEAFGRETRLRVVIKCHPGLPFSSLSTSLKVRRLPAHFEVSEQPVAELLRDCDALLYMDSTTSLEALTLGVPAVHVSSDFNLDLDPLDGAPEVRVTVRTPEQLREAVLSAGARPASSERVRCGQEIISFFFCPPDAAAYRPFLDLAPAIGLREEVMLVRSTR